MASSPRGRSGTVNKQDIVIYEDEPRSDDLAQTNGARKSIFDVDVDEPVKQDPINSYQPVGPPSLFGDGDKAGEFPSVGETDVNEHNEMHRDSGVRNLDNRVGQDRNFSTNTAIYLVRRSGGSRGSDPFVEHDPEEDEEEQELDRQLEDVYEEDSNDEGSERQADRGYEFDEDEDEDDNLDAYNHSQSQSRVTSVEVDDRKVSDFSTLPDDVYTLPTAPTPPIWNERGSYRVSVSARTSPARSTNRLQSSPQTTGSRHFSPAAAVQAKDGRFVSSPLARHHHSSAFRNPSSVREMQLSSPSPPPALNHTPRSARQRRMALDMANSSPHNEPLSRTPGAQSSRVPSNIGSPMTPSRNAHPNPQKEYPLVLLHCSFSSPPLPYSPAVLRAALPEPLQESLMLLREKLGPTVVERGILIPHPREDYELLEERVLESLELKTPRLGKCGHFIGSDSRKSSGTTEGARDEDLAGEPNEEGKPHPKCRTCGKHVADGHRGCLGDNHKRWDLRIYASNGLMRAGAWATAWREMEKVDIEIGIWLSEDVRFALEREAQLELDRDGGDPYYDGEGTSEHFGHGNHNGGGVGASNDRPRSAYGKSDSMPASTAACSRATSRQPKPNTKEREPLTSLLLRYLERNVLRRTDLLVHVVVVVLALAVFMQWKGEPQLHHELGSLGANTGMDLPVAHPVHMPEPEAAPISEIFSSTLTQQEPLMTRTITEKVKATIAPCSFTAGREAELGLTAVPADVARSVLSAAEPTASEQTEVPLPSVDAEVEEQIHSSEAPLAASDDGS